MLQATTTDDEPFLWTMLMDAGYPPGTTRPPDPWSDDHLVRYLDGWGRSGDLGLVAWQDGRRVGAAWTRLMDPERPGYGFVEATVPELTVAVTEAARGRGIGRALVAGILDLAAIHGHERVSLSVADRVNPGAHRLYASLGFATVGRDGGGSLTMVSSAAPAGPGPDAALAAARLAGPLDGPAIARLRQVMIAGMGTGETRLDWVGPLLAMWPGQHADRRWVGALVDGPHGRPVASALAAEYASPPAPGRPHGRVAQVGSVATDASWRRRGAARAAVTRLLDELDERGVESSTLNASVDGAGLYRSLGYREANGRAMRRP